MVKEHVARGCIAGRTECARGVSCATRNFRGDAPARFRYFKIVRVLLVEDHTDTRTVLTTLLNRCGCQTVAAKTISEARTRLHEMQFDTLVTDLNLPDGDGVDLVREAKGQQELKAIALTGRASDDDRETGLEAGFDYHLTKPIDFQELRKALKT